MKQFSLTRPARTAEILDAAVLVFGRLGFRKASMDDIADAAGISKQGLYLHFLSKETLFLDCLRKYLDDGLTQLDAQLSRKDLALVDRLTGAMDTWFGRHLSTFGQSAVDIIEAEETLGKTAFDRYRAAFRRKIAEALTADPEFKDNVCSPEEVANVLFIVGLTWKEERGSRSAFVRKMRLCVRVACQLN